MTAKVDVHTRPVIASLFSHSSNTTTTSPTASRPGAKPGSGSSQSHRSSSSNPFSSVAVCPNGSYAVASRRDVLHVLRLNLNKNAVRSRGGVGVSGGTNRLEEIRSVRISQHFQAPPQPTTSGTGSVGSNLPSSQYPHVWDALRPSGGPGSVVGGACSVGAKGSAMSGPLPTPTAGGGGGVNVSVTDVAWSLPQSYVVDNGSGSNKCFGQGRDGGTVGHDIGSSAPGGFGDSSDNGSGLSSPDNHDSEQHLHHYPSFVKRIHIGSGQIRTKETSPLLTIDETSIVAAAGSNGVVVAWNAHSALLGGNLDSASNANKVTSAASIGQPEAVFLGHSRAVNRLAWHPTGRRPYLLLSASQDGTVKLWDRRASSASTSSTFSGQSNVTMSQPALTSQSQPFMSWFGFGTPTITSTPAPSTSAAVRIAQTSKWHCVSTFHPKCEAVRDIRWNPFLDDVFAMVTDNGMLCIYDIRLNKPMIQSPAHSGEATTVDWHPTRKYTIATGGGRDRSVKVWDLEGGLNIQRYDESTENIKMNSNSLRSENSESLTIASMTSSDGVINSPPTRSGDESDGDFSGVKNGQNFLQSNVLSGGSPMRRVGSGYGFSHSRYHKQISPIYVLSISAPVTRIRWRPPEDNSKKKGGEQSNSLGEISGNHHDSMIAVATSSITGANAGGNGAVGLWSYHRPFMPLSVVEGHQDGAVTDFAWVDRPLMSRSRPHSNQQNDSRLYHDDTDASFNAVECKQANVLSIPSELPSYRYNRERNAEETYEGPASHLKRICDINASQRYWVKQEYGQTDDKISREWQTILTVGRDGQCLLQNFSLGERPILSVPSGTFALANLSPFQPGYGSLQLMSVHQYVDAPDILKGSEHSANIAKAVPKSEIIFSVTDQGDVRDLPGSFTPCHVDVSPEVTHLSRFAELYSKTTGTGLATKADVCRYNSSVAERLNRRAVKQMWKSLATILDGSGLDELPHSSSFVPQNSMAFLLVPTIQKLLLQRADAGDVQSCVIICEVMNVIAPPNVAGSAAKSKLPNIGIEVLREWYLSYIDLLQQMCLFTQAASLIRNCRDPVIGALNQQSTSFVESCPLCGKPLLGPSTVQDSAGASRLTTQRICRSCRGRVGMCFLCHEPVKGIFVWCPGCGHGGHLDHALEWFGASEVCPTGCGHKCNLFPTSTTAPKQELARRTLSLV